MPYIYLNSKLLLVSNNEIQRKILLMSHSSCTLSSKRHIMSKLVKISEEEISNDIFESIIRYWTHFSPIMTLYNPFTDENEPSNLSFWQIE